MPRRRVLVAVVVLMVLGAAVWVVMDLEVSWTPPVPRPAPARGSVERTADAHLVPTTAGPLRPLLRGQAPPEGASDVAALHGNKVDVTSQSADASSCRAVHAANTASH